eukprot:5822427-Amphidinium_carterae.1
MQREAEDRARRAETAQLEVELKSRLDEANRLMAAAEAAQKVRYFCEIVKPRTPLFAKIPK